MNDDKNKTQQVKNDIPYRGEVKIQFVRDKNVKKTIKKHNEGTSKLFQIIAMALARQDIESLTPHYLDVVKGDGSSILLYRPTVTAVTPKQAVGSQGAWATDYTAFVSSSNIASNENKFTELRLYYNPTGEDSLLARMSLENPEQIPTGYAIAIDWQLIIGNYVESSTTGV